MAAQMDTDAVISEDNDKKHDNSDEEMQTDSESSDSDNDDKTDAIIIDLQSQITANPYAYDPYLKLIALLREQGELEKARKVRQNMSEIFPLAEELWLSWLQDEMKVVTSPSERKQVLDLFEKAVGDYLSVSVWLEYVQFAIGGMSEEDGINKARAIFEKAITATGLHVAQGSNIWEAYREFENAIYAGLQPMPGSVPTTEQQSVIDAQHKRITDLFKRQLSVPLLDMENAYAEYEDWCTEGVDTYIKNSYEKALAKLKDLYIYEKKLLKAELPKLKEYEEYIEYELSNKEPTRIQFIFERAIKDNCLVTDIWLKYASYMDNNLRIKDLIFKVYERGLRNCPWSVVLWSNFLRALERHKESHEKITNTFDKAITSGGFTQGPDYLQIWTAYCDYMRRRIDWDKEHKQELDDLRDTFEKATTHIFESFPADGDPTCSLHQYWAKIEAKDCKNMEKCRELWSEILESGHRSYAQTWIDYLHIEKAYGDIKHCRKLLQRAINAVTDWPESICTLYINFEREEGHLEQYDNAVLKCELPLKRAEERRKKEAEKEEKQKKWEESQKSKKKAAKDKQKKDTKPKKNIERLKLDEDLVNSSNTEKEVNGKSVKRKHESEKSPVKLDNEGFKIPPPKSTTAPPPGFKGPPPPGYKGPPPDYKQNETQEPPSKKPKGDSAESANPQSEFHPVGRENCTVFLSNLGFDVDKEQIQGVFSKVGDIKEIRVVKSIKGKSKGYAYVEFIDEFPVAEALKLDREPIDGRPVYVSKCDPSRSQDKFKFSVGMEKNKLFIKGLPFSHTKEDVANIFKEHGKLKDLRIVTYRSGASKGLAYIEYEQEADASKAVLKTDGLEIGEHVLSVAISNPPARKMPMNQRESTFTPSLGGGKKEIAGRGKSASRLGFMPRSVNKTPQSHGSGDAGQSQEADPKKAKMSNSDFRSMLLKK